MSEKFLKFILHKIGKVLFTYMCTSHLSWKDDLWDFMSALDSGNWDYIEYIFESEDDK